VNRPATRPAIIARHLLSDTEPFPFSRPTFEASKTVFNLVAADNDFEREFAQFLQDAHDVRSFAMLPRRFGFAIEYTDSATTLPYESDLSLWTATVGTI
jgi:type III restriction enzyme